MAEHLSDENIVCFFETLLRIKANELGVNIDLLSVEHRETGRVLLDKKATQYKKDAQAVQSVASNKHSALVL